MPRFKILEGIGVGTEHPLDRSGFLVGRGSGSDLRLPDDGIQKSLSREHLRVDRVGGDWMLVDLSTNGVFVNGEDTALGRGEMRKLEPGDRLRLGPDALYVLQFLDDADVRQDPVPGGDFVDWEGGLLDSDPAPPGRRDVDPWPDFQDPFHFTTDDPPIPDPVPPPPGPDRPAPAGPGGGDTALLNAFLKGAGLEPADIAAGTAPEVLLAAGTLCRALVEGLLPLLDLRRQVKQEYGIEGTVFGASGNNPLKTQSDPAACLAQLLLPPRQRYLTGGAAARQAFNDIRQHGEAEWQGMQSVLHRLLADLAPAHLEQTMPKLNAAQAAIPGMRSAGLWRHYQDRYRQAQETILDSLPSRYSRSFADAYRATPARDAAADAHPFGKQE